MIQDRRTEAAWLKNQMEVFEQRCHEAGLKVTPQRVTVFRALLESREHPSVEMVYRQVRKEMPHISLDTVNRTLVMLSEIGAAAVVSGSEGVRRFDANLDDHHHFRCIQCRRIIDLDYDPFEGRPLPEVIPGGHRIVRRSVCLEGVCEACNAEDRPTGG